jgi:hypothetical protein
MAVVRLADLDPRLAAAAVLDVMIRRVARDLRRMGLALAELEEEARGRVLAESETYRTAYACAAWAKTGDGMTATLTPAVMGSLIKQVQADLAGDEAAPREADPATLPGLVVVAAQARLALLEGRAVTAVELATLAGVDERSIRAAVVAKALRPVIARRPMRFAPSEACVYLYARGVPGFVLPPGAAVPGASQHLLPPADE